MENPTHRSDAPRTTQAGKKPRRYESPSIVSYSGEKTLETVAPAEAYGLRTGIAGQD